MALRAGSYYFSPAVELEIHTLCFPCSTAHCKLYMEKSFSLPHRNIWKPLLLILVAQQWHCAGHWPLTLGHARTLCLIKAHITHHPSSLKFLGLLYPRKSWLGRTKGVSRCQGMWRISSTEELIAKLQECVEQGCVSLQVTSRVLP